MPIPNPAYGTSGYGTGGYGNQPVEFNPIGFYKNRITSEYFEAEKFHAFLLAMLRKYDNVTNCLVQMDYYFDLDNAVGVILDIIGGNHGVSRTVDFQPSNGVSPVLDDDTYRLLIKAQIGRNHWDGRIGSLYDLWQSLFPGGKIIIADQQNMTAIVVLSGTFTSIIQDLISHGYIVPRPQGVLYDYVFAELPIFGTDLNNGFIAGADLGHAA